MFIMLYQDSSNGHTNFKWRVNTIIQYLVIDKFNSDLSLVLSIYHSKCKHGSFSYVYITKKNVNLILYLTIYSRISVDHLKYFNKPINKNIAVHHLSYFYKVINNKEGKKQFENADCARLVKFCLSAQCIVKLWLFTQVFLYVAQTFNVWFFFRYFPTGVYLLKISFGKFFQ